MASEHTVVVTPADKVFLPFSPLLNCEASLNDLLASYALSLRNPDKSARSSLEFTKKEKTAFIKAMLIPPFPRPRLSTPDKNKMFTDNQGVANISTKNPLVDLFYELEKTVFPRRLHELLDSAWERDRLATLKIVWHARSISHGKGERETFYRCMGWLRQNSPIDLLVNLEMIVEVTCRKPVSKQREEAGRTGRDGKKMDVVEQAEEVELNPRNARSHGYWKDLLNILVLSAEAQLTVEGDFGIFRHEKTPKAPREEWTFCRLCDEYVPRFSGGGGDEGRGRGRCRSHGRSRATGREQRLKAENVERALENGKKRSLEAAEERKVKRTKVQNTLLERLETSSDPFHALLHYRIAAIFANQLRRDKFALESEDFDSISLAAKWAPTSGKFHDRYTMILSSIAEAIYPQSEHSIEGEDRVTYLARVRDWTRKEYLSPLRKHLDLVELKMSANEWDSVKYDRVPSLAMDKNKKHFIKKDRKRFQGYMKAVGEGKRTISGATLTPATLVKQIVDRTDKDDLEVLVVEGQWETLVRSIEDEGKLEDCIAVADVSGSMTYPEFGDGTNPMHSSIGLSLILAQVCKPPFKGFVITFSRNPEFFQVQGTLSQKVESLQKAPWGENTDFLKVFEMILQKATDANLKPENMVKRIFVFSDMEFDAADAKTAKKKAYATHLDIIRSKFKAKGYALPELVFWNLAGGKMGLAAKPVGNDRLEGMAMVSGYSAALMKTFGEGANFEDEEKNEDGWQEIGAQQGKEKQKIDPLSVVMEAISHESFKKLRVV